MPGWPAGYPSRGAWQFRNVTQDFAFWPTLESVSISQLHPDGIMAMSCTVPDPDESISFDDDDEARVLFRGTRIWAGHIRVRSRSMLSEAGPRVWALTGQDYTAKLDDSVILSEDERARETVSARVDWILGHLNYAITTGGVSLPAENVEPATYEGMSVSEALRQVSDEKLLHFYVDFEKDLHLFRTENVAADFDLSTSPDYAASFPFSDFDYQTDTIELTNAVRVKGRRHRAWRTDAASITDHGRQESAIIDDALTTMEQVIAAGNRRLYQLAEPIVEGSLTCWEPGFMAGRTFDLTHDAWPGVDGTHIVTAVDISAVDPHDEAGEALLRSEIRFSDKRRVGRFPGSGRHPKDEGTDGGGGGGGGGDGPGTCCDPVDTGPADLISWAEGNIMGFEQGHTSGTSHSIVLPDGSGYPGGVVGGEIVDRQVLVFMMTTDELPGSGGNVDLMPSPWTTVATTAIGCTHGTSPANYGHPNMQTRVFRFDVDGDPGEYDETGAVVILASDDATEVLWVSVLIGGSDTFQIGPSATDWDMSDWTPVGLVGAGNRALYFSVAFNRAWDVDDSALTPGSPLFPEQHDTPAITGMPSGFTRLTQAEGGEKFLNVDYALSPVSPIGTLSMTGYTGSSSGSQDFIITKLFGVEVSTTVAGEITPGPTWEGGNPLLYDGGSTPAYTITDGVVTITSDEWGKVWSWYAIGPPDLPLSLDDWTITQRFNLSEAGSLSDDGRRYLRIAADRDGHYLDASVRFGDPQFAQGIWIDDVEDTFVAKDIDEGEWHVFKVMWDGTNLHAKMWLEADPEPSAWDVTSVTLDDALDPESDGLDRFYYAVGIGNDGGTPMVLELPSPQLSGGALAGESVDWEIVGYGDGTTTDFFTSYPYDELTLQVRVDEELLGGTAFSDLDGAGAAFTLAVAPYGDPVEGEAGSSVVKARYTRS